MILRVEMFVPMLRTGARLGAADPARNGARTLQPLLDDALEFGFAERPLRRQVVRALHWDAVLVLIGIDTLQVRVPPRRFGGRVARLRRIRRRKRSFLAGGDRS